MLTNGANSNEFIKLYYSISLPVHAKENYTNKRLKKIFVHYQAVIQKSSIR